MKMIQVKSLPGEARDASTSCAHPRKSTRRSDRRSSQPATDSSAKTATKTTSTTISVSSVNRSTPMSMKTKIRINGLVAINAKDGYFPFYF